MSQHIAFVVNNYPPRVGGVEKHVGALAAHLVALGHRVTVFTVSDEPGVSVEGGVRVHRLPRRFPVADVIAFPPLGTTRRLASALREQGVTVVSTHTRFFPLTWVGIRAARRAGVPTIHTEHGSDYVRSQSASRRVRQPSGGPHVRASCAAPVHSGARGVEGCCSVREATLGARLRAVLQRDRPRRVERSGIRPPGDPVAPGVRGPPRPRQGLGHLPRRLRRTPGHAAPARRRTRTSSGAVLISTVAANRSTRSASPTSSACTGRPTRRRSGRR